MRDVSSAGSRTPWLARVWQRLHMRKWTLAGVLRALVTLIPLSIMLPYTLGLRDYQPVTRIDQRVYSRRLYLFDVNDKPDERIVIIDIDEASLKQHGRWPWHRDVIGRLSTELLERQKVAALGFDVLFAEPDDNDSLHVLRQWLKQPNAASQDALREVQMLKTLLDRDSQLAQRLNRKPVVLGYYFSSNQESGQTGQLPRPLPVQTDANPTPFTDLPRIVGYAANLPALVHAAPAGGFVNSLIDSDGELRSIPLIAQQGEGAAAQYYPSLSLALLMQVLNNPQVRLVPLKGHEDVTSGHRHIAGIELKQGADTLFIPTDIHGTMLVPFRGHGGKAAGQFRYISASDIINGKLSAGQLQGRVVLAGTTVPGLRDLRPTPVSQSLPGVEIHAALLSGMLDGHFIYVPDYARGFGSAMVLLAVLILMVMLPRVGAGGAWAWCSGLVLAMIAINVWAYVHARVVLPLAAGVLTVIMAYILHMSYGFFLEARAKKQLASLFGHYVPAALVSEMVKQPDHYSMKAQSRELTIMFCDIQHFTRLAETFGAEQVQELLNRLFDRMAEIIAPNQGTIDKYIGDCLMAFWGAPLPVADHAALAVKTALDITAMLATFNEEQIELGLPPIEVGIGINTGVVSVGDMGSSIRRSYTVLGDAVNLAARLEPLAKSYGVLAAVGERTVKLAPQFHWQWMDTIRVAGKSQSVNVYAPMQVAFGGPGTLSHATQTEIDQWQLFHAAYLEREWAYGLRLLDQLQALRPHKKLYAIYRQRLLEFQMHPPAADWDGVIDMEK